MPISAYNRLIELSLQSTGSPQLVHRFVNSQVNKTVFV